MLKSDTVVIQFFDSKPVQSIKNSKMHNVLSRIIAAVYYALVVLACATFCCYISTIYIEDETTAHVNTVGVLVKNMPNYWLSGGEHDLGLVTFDLETNLTGIFNWNVKQLFVYLTAEYKTPDNDLNQVILWDWVIMRGQNSAVNLKNINTKYYFKDDGHGLKNNKNVSLYLSWNIIPYVGLLRTVRSRYTHTFKFPSEYSISIP